MFDLETAKAWHRMFALHLEFVIDGVETGSAAGDSVETVADQEACRLGQWLRGASCKAYAGLPSYQHLDAAHARFHYFAAAMVRVFRESGVAAARAADAGAFRAASQEVLRAIDQFRDELVRRRYPLPGLAAATPSAVQDSLWSDALKIGDPVIDSQRKAIVQLVDRLIACPGDVLQSEAVADVLNELSRIVRLYLESEEALLRRKRVSPEEIARRVQEHNRILEESVQIHLDIMAGKAKAVDQVVPVLRAWVLERFLFSESLMKAQADGVPGAGA